MKNVRYLVEIELVRNSDPRDSREYVPPTLSEMKALIAQMLYDKTNRYEGEIRVSITAGTRLHIDDPLRADCAEFVLDDGRRFAWSESNVRYEEVSPDSESFTLMRTRLQQLQAASRIVLKTLHADYMKQELWDALTTLRKLV